MRPPPASALQKRKECARHPNGAPEMRIKDTRQVGVLQMAEILADEIARVVYENIHRVETVSHHLQQAADINFPADIRGDELRLTTPLDDGFRGRLPAGFVFVGDDDKRAFSCERSGDGDADSGGGACNDRNLAGQLLHSCAFLVRRDEY